MSQYLGALDQGTTSTRFIIFDRAGRAISTAQKEHEQIYPAPGWVEHDPREIWKNTEEVIAEACAKGSIRPEQIASVGITNQRETTVVWDKRTGDPFVTRSSGRTRASAGTSRSSRKKAGRIAFARRLGFPSPPTSAA